MVIVSSDLVRIIEARYLKASIYLEHANKYLPKRKCITLGELPKIQIAFQNLFTFLEVQNMQDQLAIVDLIFELSRCRDEKVSKVDGSHDAHIKAIKDFYIAADVIQTIMKADSDFGESKDVKSLYEYICACIPPNVDTIDKGLKNFQSKSKYSELIYQLISLFKKIKRKERLKGIYYQLDTILSEVYPIGLRESQSKDSLEKAYKKGRFS